MINIISPSYGSTEYKTGEQANLHHYKIINK